MKKTIAASVLALFALSVFAFPVVAATGPSHVKVIEIGNHHAKFEMKKSKYKKKKVMVKAEFTHVSSGKTETKAHSARADKNGKIKTTFDGFKARSRYTIKFKVKKHASGKYTEWSDAIEFRTK